MGVLTLMGLSHGYCRNFVGQPVVAHCAGGHRYYGIVHDVTQGAVILRQHGTGINYVKGNSKTLKVEKAKADKLGKVEAQPVFGYGGFGGGYGGYGYGYGAYIALPLYVLLAISLAWI